jgi:hypothetical protein
MHCGYIVYLAHTYGMSCLGKVIDIESFIQIFLEYTECIPQMCVGICDTSRHVWCLHYT